MTWRGLQISETSSSDKKPTCVTWACFQLIKLGMSTFEGRWHVEIAPGALGNQRCCGNSEIGFAPFKMAKQMTGRREQMCCLTNWLYWRRTWILMDFEWFWSTCRLYCNNQIQSDELQDMMNRFMYRSMFFCWNMFLNLCPWAEHRRHQWMRRIELEDQPKKAMLSVYPGLWSKRQVGGGVAALLQRWQSASVLFAVWIFTFLGFLVSNNPWLESNDGIGIWWQSKTKKRPELNVFEAFPSWPLNDTFGASGSKSLVVVARWGERTLWIPELTILEAQTWKGFAGGKHVSWIASDFH